MISDEQMRQALALPDDEIERVLTAYRAARFPLASPEWRSLVAQETSRRRVSMRYWRNRLLGWAISRKRRGGRVEESYDQIWAKADFAKLVDPAQQKVLLEWRQEGLMANPSITQKLHLSLMIKAVRLLRPQTVLEVGSGWGINLLILACQCPDAHWQGVELTKNGVDLTRSLADGNELPEPLLRLMPGPPVDPKGFQKIQVERGSAEKLPYPDASFDLVITRQALEQMESIREAALSEIARVARSHVLMVESFREMNNDGLRRKYVIASDYFRGRLADMPRYGLKPLFVYTDWPHKISLKPVMVLAEKIDAVP